MISFPSFSPSFLSLMHFFLFYWTHTRAWNDYNVVLSLDYNCHSAFVLCRVYRRHSRLRALPARCRTHKSISAWIVLWHTSDISGNSMCMDCSVLYISYIRIYHVHGPICDVYQLYQDISCAWSLCYMPAISGHIYVRGLICDVYQLYQDISCAWTVLYYVKGICMDFLCWHMLDISWYIGHITWYIGQIIRCATGKPYRSDSRVAYLPDSPDGRERGEGDHQWLY